MSIDLLYADAYESLSMLYDLNHVGYQRGVKYETEIKRYKGKYGEGYIVRHPSKPNSKFHMVEYWTN